MKVNLKLSAIALCVSLSVSGQNLINGRGCYTALPPAGWDEAFNKKVEEYKQNLATGRTQAAVYTIPVIVHVVYGTQAVGTYPNLSQTQISSQISVMNADYAGIGYNTSNLAATSFSTVGAADCSVSFCLAQLDPDGNPLTEAGIDRVAYSTLGTGVNPASFSSQTTFQNYIDNTVKPATIWDPTSYFNIWITDVNSNVGLLGYSTFPALSTLTGLVGNNSTAANDGIWVYSKAFGNVGTLTPTYNKGRTASHETGHYLGLRHIGGDGQANGTGSGNANGDCTATDYCNDTPPQKGGYQSGQYGQNYGTPPSSAALHANVCVASGDMFMNIMDYTDDAACYMFTPDQRTRMQTALANSPYRVNLTASSATLCSIPAVMPTASFVIASQACTDTLMQTDNQSTGFPVPTYSWSANPSNGVTFSPSATSATPTVEFTNSGTYNITMVAMNAAGTTTALNNVVVNDCTDGATGIAKNSMLYKSINLSPNPSSGIVNITTTLPASQNIDILVHNALGQLVYNTKYTNVTTGTFSLNLEACSGGVYSVTISSNSEKVVKRLILSK
jgi:zinc-dependent metalloproteinase lipoprotein